MRIDAFLIFSYSKNFCRIYGVTHDGLSVVVYAHGFLPYLYIQLPPGINTSNPDLTDLRNYLEQKVRISLSENCPKSNIFC